MTLHLPKDDNNNCELPTPICYKPDPTIGRTLMDKSYSLKVDIKTQPVERDSNMVSIYVPLFQMGIP